MATQILVVRQSEDNRPCSYLVLLSASIGTSSSPQRPTMTVLPFLVQVSLPATSVTITCSTYSVQLMHLLLHQELQVYAGGHSYKSLDTPDSPKASPFASKSTSDNRPVLLKVALPVGNRTCSILDACYQDARYLMKARPKS